MQRLGVDLGGVGRHLDLLACELGLQVRSKYPQLPDRMAGFRWPWTWPDFIKARGGSTAILCRSSRSAVRVHTAKGLRGTSGATVRRQSIASINKAS